MENLQIEIEALRIAAPLLSDDDDNDAAATGSYQLSSAKKALLAIGIGALISGRRHSSGAFPFRHSRCGRCQTRARCRHIRWKYSHTD